MNPPSSITCTAFAGVRRIATGDLTAVALQVRQVLGGGELSPILIFDDQTGEQLELDLRGSVKDVLARLDKSPARSGPKGASVSAEADSPPGPGRPRLGVIGREVTLLPRHWDWLNGQPGGASVTLRKLVESARHASAGPDRIRVARDATYRFMVAMAGNLPGFEEATRVLFARKKDRFKEFETQIRNWPGDIRRHVVRLMKKTMAMEAMPNPG